MQILLSTEMENLINQQLAIGYRSPEDVVKASLQLLQKHNEQKLEELRKELMPAVEAARRGESTVLNMTEVIAEETALFKQRQKEKLDGESR